MVGLGSRVTLPDPAQCAGFPMTYGKEGTMSTIKARASDGSELMLPTSAVEALAASLRGTLLRPDDAGYHEARAIWNGMIDRRPALIAQCLGVGDMVASVNFAHEHGVRLSIKSGGHNISGLSLADGALTIDTSRMRGVWVDPKEQRAIAQTGCVLGDVDHETQLHGLAAVLGFVSNTGIAGLTLGGGFGYLTRRFGWTSDNVRSFEVVTPDGAVVRASESEESELFWGLRGGGGNFGVVTKIEYDLYPVGPEIMGGAVAWRAEDAPEVLDMYRRITAEAPPEQTCVAALRIAPPAPWLPPEIHGKPIVAVFVCDSGPMAEAAERAAVLKGFGSPVGDILQPRPYTELQSILDATQPNGRRYYWKSEFLPGLDQAFLAKTEAGLERITSPHSATLVFPIGGKLNTLSEGHSAVGNRDTRFVVNIAAAWDDPAEDDRHIAWARGSWEEIRSFSTGGTYINFLTEEEGDARIQEAYRGNLERLVDVKSAYDPGNLLRVNKNIRPRGG